MYGHDQVQDSFTWMIKVCATRQLWDKRHGKLLAAGSLTSMNQ
jgi:hypothetical protein